MDFVHVEGATRPSDCMIIRCGYCDEVVEDEWQVRSGDGRTTPYMSRVECIHCGCVWTLGEDDTLHRSRGPIHATDRAGLLFEEG